MITNEIRLEIFRRDNYQCQNCNANIFKYGMPQLAHIIPKSKMNIARYGIDLINHPLNLKSVCCLQCNDKMNIGCKPRSENKLVDEIKHDIWRNE